MEQTVILVTEKWQVRPEPKWLPHSEVHVVARVTKKRIFARGRIYDRFTGKDLSRKPFMSWYKTSIKVEKEQP